MLKTIYKKGLVSWQLVYLYFLFVGGKQIGESSHLGWLCECLLFVYELYDIQGGIYSFDVQ